MCNSEIEKEYDTVCDELREQVTEALSNILLGEKIPLDVVNGRTGEIIIPANQKITKPLLRELASLYEHIEIAPSPIRNKVQEITHTFRKKFQLAATERKRLYSLTDTPEYQTFLKLLNRAEAGDPQAQYELGCSYVSGRDFRKDEEEGEVYLKAAAKQGHIKAQTMLGDLCAVQSNMASALEYYAKAVSQGDVEAMTKIGDVHGELWRRLRYQDWSAGMTSFQSAVECYCKAAGQGSAEAKYKLGRCCSEFKEPVDVQYSFSELCATFLEPVIGNFGRGEEERLALVARLYSDAANEGNVRAQTAFGDCLAEGIGIEKDSFEAARWYQNASEQGDAEAQRKVGDCYLNGWILSEKNREYSESNRGKRAVKYFRKAAKQGDAEAQEALAYCYENGIGVAKDGEIAERWQRKAARNRDRIGDSN